MKWLVVRIAIFIGFTVLTWTSSIKPVNPTDAPYWAMLIPFIFFALALPPILQRMSLVNKDNFRSQSIWISKLNELTALVHLFGLIVLSQSIGASVAFKGRMDFNTMFSLSAAVGILVGVHLFVRKVRLGKDGNL